jgi:phage gpG-like protein
MSVAIHIELTQSAQKILANLQALPANMALAIAAGMDEANQFALANIVSKRLSGKGPYDVAEQRLGERSHTLIKSARTSPAVVNGNQVISAIGSNVKYAGLHEFGGRVHHPARTVKTRLRTDARGALVRQLGTLAIFAKKTHKRAKEVISQGKAYDVQIPARAPFRAGIAESAGDYRKSISKQIVAVWNAGGAA